MAGVHLCLYFAKRMGLSQLIGLTQYSIVVGDGGRGIKSGQEAFGQGLRNKRLAWVLQARRGCTGYFGDIRMLFVAHNLLPCAV